MLNLRQEGPVLTAVLETPPANALGLPELAALDELVRRLEDPTNEVRVLVLCGALRFFSGGVNISVISENATRADGVERMAAFGAELQAVFQRIEDLRIPTIAAMRGSAAGGGLELALACDFRIAGIGSVYGLPETKLGLLPGAGGTQRLTEIAGRAVALRLILRGELVSGAEAAQLGIVQWSLQGDEVEEFAQALASELAGQAPAALAATKRCIAAVGTADGFALEIEATRALMTQSETKDRLDKFLHANENHGGGR